MHWSSRILVSGLAAAILCGVPDPAAAVGFYVGGHVGYGSFTQEDLNASIQALNARVGAQLQDEIKAGGEYGVQLGVELGPSLRLGVGYSRLSATKSGAAADRESEVSVSADCWLAHFTWLPDTDSAARLGLGADGGMLQADGYARIVEFDGRINPDEFSGSGLFLAGYVVADVRLGVGAALFAHGGFRLARAANVEVNGAPSDSDLDYSGVFGRVGLSLSFGGEPR